MLTTEWVFCLICGNKTRLQIREDVQQARIKEGEFYRAFLEKLEQL